MNDDLDKLIMALRRGDELPVRRLSDLDKRDRKLTTVLDKLATIQKRGGVLVDEATGTRSDDAAGVVQMIAGNLKFLRKGATKRQARASGSKGGRPKTEREMSHEDAAKIWHDVRIPSNPEAIKLMTGWKLRSAQEAFGPSGRQLGRRKAKPKRNRK